MRFLGKSHKKRFYVANSRTLGRFLQDFDGLNFYKALLKASSTSSKKAD